VTIAAIDPQRLADELAANADVHASLAENGDVATVVRVVDVHFKGQQKNIEMLASSAEALGFRFIGFGEYEDGDWACDLEIDSTSEPSAIAELTRRALQIEILHAVEFDGWGCVATNGLEN